MLAVCLFFTLGGERWIVNNFICVYVNLHIHLLNEKENRGKRCNWF